MTETFAALLLAHVLADFAFQTDAIAQGKAERRPGPLALHMLAVALCAALVTGAATRPALEAVAVLTLLHLLIDLGKSLLPAGRLGPYIADQAVHLLSLVAVAALWPDTWATGLWASGLHLPAAPPSLPAIFALLAGVILATRAGGFAVGLLMSPWADTELPEGLRNGGFLIGQLERGLIFLFVLVDEPSAIGFLIAAKSVLRFDTARDSRAGEYIIIGTLASFGWALMVAHGTQGLMAALPPLHIGPVTP